MDNNKGTEAQKYVWEGAIPLQIHLHESEVTTLPPPPPALVCMSYAWGQPFSDSPQNIVAWHSNGIMGGFYVAHCDVSDADKRLPIVILASWCVLAPRIGYLPLLVTQIKPFFNSALPPGVDTVWFEYKGLPLKCDIGIMLRISTSDKNDIPGDNGLSRHNDLAKNRKIEKKIKHSYLSLLLELVPYWYIPTGVLFDLLCAEPERPWNLTVHFRGYPANILTPCEGEDSVKWSFINSLKEAAYVINGNCKNVMNMSQSDQVELWRSVLNVNLETYLWVSSKLKLGIAGDEFSVKLNSSVLKSQQSAVETDNTGSVKTGRIPVRLYVYNVNEDFDDLEDAPQIDSWDKISYINRPVEIHGEGKCFTLLDAVKSLLPEFFAEPSSTNEEIPEVEVGDELRLPSEECGSSPRTTTADVGETSCEHVWSSDVLETTEIKLLRIQGIEPKLEIPFGWVVNNLMNPERYLHICVYVRIPEPITI
ncbi:hypothetical protein C3L33_17951, partial [Rhododendron williamsianum]